jgi:hypothetical protein
MHHPTAASGQPRAAAVRRDPAVGATSFGRAQATGPGEPGKSLLRSVKDRCTSTVSGARSH